MLLNLNSISKLTFSKPYYLSFKKGLKYGGMNLKFENFKS